MDISCLLQIEVWPWKPYSISVISLRYTVGGGSDAKRSCFPTGSWFVSNKSLGGTDGTSSSKGGEADMRKERGFLPCLLWRQRKEHSNCVRNCVGSCNLWLLPQEGGQGCFTRLGGTSY